MPPPVPPKGNSGKVWGVVGAIAGVLILGSAAFAMIHGSGSTGGSSGPKFQITVPKTLAGGAFTLAKDISQQASASIPHDGTNAHGVSTAGGQYTGGTKSLVMLGLYGTIDDPQEAVDHTLQGMTRDGNTHVAVPDKKFTPTGGGDSLTCGVDVREKMGQKITLPYCVWADSSTSGNVAETDASDLAKNPSSIDLQAFADTASKIRSEVTKPL
ncbi:hypothetical protein [Streptomyces sp. YGL11-2]|uniref:hypothetical protein n=1 Tax=Streptomyces sp. YGL11-2 TaxID=3414028 RepID=UPI003CFAE611